MGREAGGRGAAVAGSQRIASRFATCSEAAQTDPSTDCGAGRERRGSKGSAEVLVSRSWVRGSALGRGGEGQAWAGVHVLC